MKRVIFVNKAAMSFVTREEARRASATGEQGDTEGWLRHLMARDDFHVVYVGRTRGDMTGLCHEIYTPETHGIGVFDGDAQAQGFEDDAKALRHYEACALIQTAGPCYTMSWINNPKYTTVQQQSIHYMAPMLSLCHTLGLKRIVINNDPRTYPRDQEMSFGWPECRPAALLDQCEASGPMVVGGQQYKRISRYAACESWLYCERRKLHPAAVPVQICAHAHIGDGCKQSRREDSWQKILGPRHTWLGTSLRVYGAGWEHYSDYCSEHMPGKVRPDEALDIMNQSYVTPCVAAAPGFNTGKGYTAWSQGSIPIPTGDGTDPYTWDPRGEVIELDSPWRAVGPGDLWRIAEEVASNYAWHHERCAKAFTPRWAVLDELLDELALKGRDASWGTRFGGYFPQ